MKKIVSFIFLLLLLAAAVGAWLVLGHATGFDQNKKYLYVYTGKAKKEDVMQTIKDSSLVSFPWAFEMLADRMHVWERLKPGRFEIKKNTSLLDIVRMLRNNQQSAVNLVINKVRTIEDLVHLIDKNFEVDSTYLWDFINSSDSLRNLGVDYFTFFTIIIPNSYSIYWNTRPGKMFRKLKDAADEFWSENNRRQKAQELGFTKEQVYTLASIVEEETNKNDEKGMIASVYINRYNKGMPLGADPTIKYAMKDFSLKRIYEKYLQVESPYNTYRIKGLPPGPICTPSATTIDKVLESPRTEYLFFVAKKDFSGYHTFSTNYAEHMQHAKEYQQALDELILRKKQAQGK